MSSKSCRLSPLAVVGVFLLAAVMVIAAACGESTPTPDPTAASTPQPTVTSTPDPIATPSPEPTAVSTPEPTPTPVLSQYPLEVTGSDGQSVTLEEAPERIVAIDGATVEILFAIGEEHRIVGTHEFVTYPPEVEEIEKVGSAFALDFEKIASLDPDLIFIFFASPAEDLRRLGAPVIYQDSPGTLQGVADQIRLWGEIVDAREEAESVAAEFEEAVAAVAAPLEGIIATTPVMIVDRATASDVEGPRSPPRVFHDLAPGLWTAGSDTLEAEIYETLKAHNIFEDVSGYPQTSAEDLVARNPEVIISVYEDGPDYFRSEPAFQNLFAVRKDQLYAIDGALLSVAGPRIIEGLQTLARILYPDIFP